MPLIGNGAAGWPAKTAARIHIAEVQKFASSASAMSCLKVSVFGTFYALWHLPLSS